jgi:hypothetical protein
MVQRDRHESTGNASLLVVVNGSGSYTDTSIVDVTVLVALQHFKFPYRIHDLATGPLTSDLLAECAAVVLAQARLGDALSLEETDLVASAVEESGVGLVNFDGDLRLYQPPLLRLFGLEVDPIPMASDLLRIHTDEHFITRTQRQGSLVRLNRPVTFAQIKRVGRNVAELAQAALGKDQLIFSRHNVPGTAYEPDQFPAVLAATAGRGRAVQFACSPRIWHREFLGHGMGLDALFWRAIVWVARKPFAALMMPPYVSVRVDDGSGRHDFGYVDVLNRHGHHPLISCLLDSIPDEVVPFMQAKHASGEADWDAHAFSYYDLIPFDFGIGERSDADLRARFERIDAWYAQREIQPPATAYFHWGEIGIRALPHLKSRGRTYLYATYDIGQLKWERLFPGWWPYGLNSLFYDYLPDDPDMYNVGAVLPRHLVEPDVLTGCTTWAGDNPTNDMDKASDRAAEAVRLALDSGFYAEITTHEQKFGVLTLEEIDRWLSLIDTKTEPYDIRKVGHEHALSYTRARDESWISTASTTAGRSLELELDGASEMALEVGRFDDEDEDVALRWETVPSFRGPTTADC